MAKASTLEEQYYWDKWINSKDSQAGDFLVQKYMPLVSYHVQRIAVSLPKNISKDDLKSFGLMGLFDALEKFDRDRDLKFDTYASFRIRGSILDGLRKEDWLPRKIREKAKRLEAATEKLEQQYLRNVTAKEIAEELGINEEEVYTIQNEYYFANILSMDESPNDYDDQDGQYILKDSRQQQPEALLLKDEMIQDLANIIKTLSSKEQLVLSLFYKEELTFTEIGQIMELSTSRISQIHSKAIYKLREIMNKGVENSI